MNFAYCFPLANNVENLLNVSQNVHLRHVCEENNVTISRINCKEKNEFNLQFIERSVDRLHNISREVKV